MPDPVTKAERAPESGVVTVALKHPNGIWLRLYKMEEHDELVMGGGYRTVERAVLVDSKPILLKGNAVPFGGDRSHIRFGFGITPNVPADVWNEWLKQNAQLDLVKNGLVFAMKSTSELDAKSKEYANMHSGLEPIDPRKPPAAFRNVKPGNRSNDDVAA